MYVPQMEGQYRVIIKFATKEIPKSPFTVNVEGAKGDASVCSARGPGIEKTGVQVNKKTYFEVFVPPGKYNNRKVFRLYNVYEIYSNDSIGYTCNV